MTKIHIALVGKQIQAVCNVINRVKPDKMILLPSKDSLALAERIKEYYKGTIACDIRELPVDNLVEINKIAEDIFDSIDTNNEVSLDLTTGLKSWAICFFSIFREKSPQADIYYIYQENKLFNLTTEKEVGEVDFDYKLLFWLHNINFPIYTPYSVYTSEDFITMNALKEFYHKHSKVLTPLMKQYGGYMNKNKLTVQDNVEFSCDKGKISWNVERNTITIEISEEEKVTVSSPLVWHLVNGGGWFEYYVATVMANIYQPDQIFMNCHFKGPDNNDMNEVDIIVNTGKKLLFVECKTQIKGTTEINKFANVVRTYGALSSKSLFVTYWPMYRNGKEMCERCSIPTFNMTSCEEKDLINNLKEQLDIIINRSNLG